MDRIIVGVDGSKGSELAFRWALREAAVHDAILEVVAVHPYPEVVGVPGAQFPIERTEDVEARARQALDELCERVVGPDAEVEVVPIVLIGNVADRLRAAAAHADLLVVGARGVGGFRGLLLGSVSQQCVQHATCPTVVVPTPPDA
ncbi:MAG: universal stress protein [Actinobacteria bacterium]|nr:universal stress protein [Actinomycetota bacterium]